jgi:hypothetical protein
MIEWHEGEPPKVGRFLMIARTKDAGPEVHNWEMVVGHWHEVHSAYVPTGLPFDLRQGSPPRLQVSHWAEIETPVSLRPLDDRDTRG